MATESTRTARPVLVDAPAWVDRAEYPFTTRAVPLPAGRMHYVDEGQGETLLFVHGTPTWSFLWRHLIKALAPRYRCVAVDHIGFGLSDKPATWGYRPIDHAQNLDMLIDRLKLRDVTLVVHDFGGPIGLSHAIERPDNVKRLVLVNTWMWSLAQDASARRLSRFVSGPIGRFLYRRLNVSPRILLPGSTRRRLSRVARRQYLAPFPTAESRDAPWILGTELLGSSGFFERLWERRDRLVGKPTLLLWGLEDSAYGPDALARWQGLLGGSARVVGWQDVGHLPTEEVPEACVAELEAFLRGGPLV
jgi:pimeloyl-ACP methyl ester carboxylesterase